MMIGGMRREIGRRSDAGERRLDDCSDFLSPPFVFFLSFFLN